MFQETHLRKSREEVIVEVSQTSVELIAPISHTSLELFHAPFTCPPTSPFLECSVVKPMDNYVITNPTYDLGLVDIEKEQLEGNVDEFDRSLGNHRGCNPSIDPT